MKNKKLTISSLAASLLLGLAVTSFAGVGITSQKTNFAEATGGSDNQTAIVCSNPVQAPELTYGNDN